MHEAARPAGAADHDEIRRLAQAARAEARTKRGGDLLVDHDLVALSALPIDALSGAHAGPTAAVVGTVDDVVVGYALAHTDRLADGGLVAFVEELYVDPEARAVGIGELMMDELITWATDAGCVGIDARALPGDRQTKNFFETFGLVARQIVVHRRLGPAEPEPADPEPPA